MAPKRVVSSWFRPGLRKVGHRQWGLPHPCPQTSNGHTHTHAHHSVSAIEGSQAFRQLRRRSVGGCCGAPREKGIFAVRGHHGKGRIQPRPPRRRRTSWFGGGTVGYGGRGTPLPLCAPATVGRLDSHRGSGPIPKPPNREERLWPASQTALRPPSQCPRRAQGRESAAR
jgi:hypothetical protein